VNTKIVHVLGGGLNQVPIINMIKSLGHAVLVTDMYENPPCKAIADYFHQVNTTDLDGSLEVARLHKVDAVLTDQTDVAVPTVAFIAREMGLEGIGYDTALRFTNKYLMRDYLKDRLPKLTPEFHYFENPNDAIAYCQTLKHAEDFIIKPINSQGSKGVYQLKNKDNAQLVSSSFNEAQSNGVILEEFIQGIEYSVESYKQDDTIYNLAVTKKYHYESNDCIDFRNTYLGDVSEELEKKLFDANSEVIAEMDLPFGVTHAEYKVTDKGEIYLIEIAARGGGGSISSKIMPYLTQFEPNRALIHRALKLKYHVPKISDYKKRFAVLQFYSFSPGKIKKIYINESMVSKAVEFSLTIKAGDTLNPILDSRDRPGYFVVIGEDREKVLNLEQEILEAVQIEYEG
jgi:biotin carboxylase